ncbi:uncharacterized protein KY384_006812 [Bacidia gigantensis]|uniref:uncharacterized protein n=1 Tax=Bacidia gigantensis TaxID=2732470 RepID=UPI001D03AB72|nr:uncharacterized protein KY384_006812 [Bacidia gigantensis]KAG8527896.1 hypothetical protein KY384_006812 [Bacidia gigantensis]
MPDASSARATPTDDIGVLPTPVTQSRKSIGSRSSVTGRFNRQQHSQSKGDELERRLRSEAAKDPWIRDFLIDYHQFKNQTCSELFPRLFKCYNIQSPSQLALAFHVSPPDKSSDSIETFSESLERLRLVLNAEGSEAVRLCVLTWDGSNALQSQMYSLAQKLFATADGLQRRYDAPRLALIHVINQEWKLSKAALKACTSAMTLRDLPSSIGPPDSPPESLFAQVFINNDGDVGRKVLLLYRSMESSDGPLSDYAATHQRLQPPDAAKLENMMTSEILTLIHTIYLQLIEDTSSFIESAYDQIDELRYTGRSKPEDGKLHYLLHFRDCCHLSAMGLQHATSLLREITSPEVFNISEEDQNFLSWPERVQEDLIKLQKKITSIEAESETLREMIERQLQIRMGQRTTLLTVLAAIYIPLSFMSSLFGMNLKPNPFWPSKPHNSSQPDSLPTNGNIADPGQNQTRAIVSAIDNSGPYLFRFSLYWSIAVPVTIATIIVPLVAGSVFRSALKAFYRNRTYVRFFVLLMALGAVVALDVLTPRLVYLVVFGVVLGSVALVTIFRASKSGKNQLTWCGYSIAFAAGETMDLNFGYRWIGVTGYICLGYLILVWLGPHVFLIMFPTRRRSDNPRRILDALKAFGPKKHKKIFQHVLSIVVYFAFAAFCIYFLPFDIYISFFANPFGILAVNRLIRSFFLRHHLALWIAYTVIFLISFSADMAFVRSDGHGPGLVGFLPMAFLFGSWIYLDHKTYFDTRLRRTNT